MLYEEGAVKRELPHCIIFLLGRLMCNMYQHYNVFII